MTSKSKKMNSEINVKEIFWRFFEQWKAVLLFSVAIALLTTGVKYYLDLKDYARSEDIVSPEDFRGDAEEILESLTDVDRTAVQKLMKEKMAFVQMKGEFAKREVNVGFSGGEKKRNEIFQMAMLDPVLSILDETDSGLDVDALRIVADGVNALHTPEKAAIIITHYQKLLEYVVPDVVHVLKEGRIVATGGRELVDLIERKGFDSF